LRISTQDDGAHVIKNVRTGNYYNLAQREAFLLIQLDGTHSLTTLCEAFEKEFGYPVAKEDVREFIELATSSGLLESDNAVRQANLVKSPRRARPPEGHSGSGTREPEDDPILRAEPAGPRAEAEEKPRRAVEPQPAAKPNAKSRGNLLYWRRSLFDPDQLFDRLEPWLRFIWTRAFFLVSAACVVAAGFIAWQSRDALTSPFKHGMIGQTLVFAYVVLIIVTLCHEISHGLTCKHYGGEVHEVGFLLMFFIPCLYCNVSDAWLIKRKSHRLWVTLAGAWCDLVLFAGGILVWRVTAPNTLPNLTAWLVLSICGARIAFNFNPLLKLDGYYLLSDWLEIPNLRQRAWDRLVRHIRWLLWGGARPAPEPRGRFLLGFGIASWLYSFMFLSVMLFGLLQLLGTRFGLGGVAAGIILAVMLLRGLFSGFAGSELGKMLATRRQRAASWGVVLATLALAMTFGRINDQVTGTFHVQPGAEAEVRAPAAAFLTEVYGDEGDRVAAGQIVAKLEIPDLNSRTAQKRAEIAETQAKLKLLEAGTRSEDIAEQTQRVARAVNWRDSGKADLDNARAALAGELAQLDQLIEQADAQAKFTQEACRMSQGLYDQSAISGYEYLDRQLKAKVAQSQLQQARAQRQARTAVGTTLAENELARREKDLAETIAVLTLMKAGTRPEEIEAERAMLARQKEELSYLEKVAPQLLVRSTVAGLISTPHLRRKLGQYFREGELVCMVEEPSHFEAEVSLAEQDAASVRPGQAVELKARAGPFGAIPATVERIAAAALPGESQSTLTVYCRATEAAAELRPGMTGFARISCGTRSIAAIAIQRAMRLLRTEFWL
jgi:multidrug efflux pump subunit AcrA (membrane-fusion protein)